eukprot:scaffold37239_cov167-Skeletonema_dohrnii-CCMP3373.AAC.1
MRWIDWSRAKNEQAGWACEVFVSVSKVKDVITPAAAAIFIYLAPANQRGVVCKLCAANESDECVSKAKQGGDRDVWYTCMWCRKSGRVHWGRTAKEQKYTVHEMGSNLYIDGHKNAFTLPLQSKERLQDSTKGIL